MGGLKATERTKTRFVKVLRKSCNKWKFHFNQFSFNKMSSTLKFYHGMGSPVSRGCLMLLRKLGLDVEVKLVNLAAGEQNNPEFLKLNPMHQVPVLVDEDFVLTESRAILAYLVNKFQPGSSLYPADPKARAVVDQRLYYDASVVFESCAQIIVRTETFKTRERFLFFPLLHSVSCCIKARRRFRRRAERG